jgi:asparagine synthase (glutamine-hydrolysing)
MCGIHGIVRLSGEAQFERALLSKMGHETVHRGPDDEGIWVGDGVAIGMRRLSIIDLSGGHQPISNHDDTLWVVCNGEIYNFREEREKLVQKGHRFKTKSDSEVVLHAYAEYGDEFIHHLDGMFGFALYDVKRRRLLVGRDHLGIKPIYYYQDRERLVFASEAKAILAVPGITPAIDPVGLAEYLRLGYAPAPQSIMAGIQKLPVASMLVIEGGRVDVRRYWRMPKGQDDSKTETEWARDVKSELERAVVSQLVADVPLGAFLSGGIDSSAIVAFMAKNLKEPVKTYSIGFEGGEAEALYNELPYAKTIASLYRTHHKEILVRPDVATLLPKLLWHLDEPVGDSAFITTFLVSEFARKDVKVILSGVGGDELFGGYRRYLGEFYGQFYQKVPGLLRTQVISRIAQRLPADRHHPLLNLSRLARSFVLSSELPFEARYRRYVGAFSDEQLEQLAYQVPPGEDAIARAFHSVDRSDPLRAMFEVDAETQLPDDLLMLTDKMTMAASLECRVPFLDRGLVELAAKMPGRFKIRGRTLKHILKVALADVLPHDILHRKKRGFGAPMGAWIKHQLAPLIDRMLAPEVIKKRGLFRPAAVAETLALHRANKEDHTDHLLALLNLEIWCRLYLDRQSPSALTEQIKAEIPS